MQYHLHEGENILSIRMPVCFKRRSSRKMIIAPSGVGALLNNIDLKAQKPDQSFVAALVKAFQWQDLVDQGGFSGVRIADDGKNGEPLPDSSRTALILMAGDIGDVPF